MSVHSARLERWLGSDRLEQLANNMQGWYGPPIQILDCPSNVFMTADGDFIGNFDKSIGACAVDMFLDKFKKIDRALIEQRGVLNAGFASIGDALSRASSGYSQQLNGNITKSGPTGVIGVSSSLWRVGAQPVAGGAGSAAPSGRAPTDATTGAMAFNNPSGGDTLHLVGADFSASVINNSIMVYDRIFDVAKTMNSTATESVTGVPTRYQSSTLGDPDYAGGNFLFIEVGGTALAATAHNWTTCLYRDQDGNDSQTLPSVTGNSGAIVDRFDMPVNTWFCPLASGDSGIMDLAQMQCSAAVATGAINFVIGHPLGVMSFPVINSLLPFDWLTNRKQAPRIFDDACVAMFELPKPATTATTYNGMIYVTSAAA